MLGLMRAARNMKLPPGPPPKNFKDVMKGLGQALILAIIIEVIVGGPILLLTFMERYHRSPPTCTCDMVKRHECLPP